MHEHSIITDFPVFKAFLKYLGSSCVLVYAVVVQLVLRLRLCYHTLLMSLIVVLQFACIVVHTECESNTFVSVVFILCAAAAAAAVVVIRSPCLKCVHCLYIYIS